MKPPTSSDWFEDLREQQEAQAERAAIRAKVAEMVEYFTYYPKPPYRAEPYSAVRGTTWTIVDGNDRHIATVFEEKAALLIAARLNA